MSIEERSLKNRAYYQEHKEVILANSKIYYVNNLEKLREKGREYRVNNLEKVREKDRECRKRYIASHKEQVDEKNNKKFACECGGKYAYKNKYIHEKSKKHQNFCQHVTAV